VLPDINDVVDGLRGVLKKWKENAFLSEPGKPELVAYILNYQYSKNNLGQGIRAMKGEDAYKLIYL